MKSDNRSVPSAKKMVVTGISNAAISGYLNGKMEPYNVATLQTHLGHEVRHDAVSKAGKLKVGMLDAVRSFSMGLSAIYGPQIMESKGLDKVQAENATAAVGVAINTCIKHGILTHREGALKGGPNSFTSGMSTTVFTTLLQQKAFLASMRYVQEANAGDDGKLHASGLALSAGQVGALGSVVSPIAQFATTYSRYAEDLTRNLKSGWERNGIRAVARVAFPKSAMITGAVNYGASSILSAVGREIVDNPIDDETIEKIGKGVGFAKRKFEEMVGGSSGRSR